MTEEILDVEKRILNVVRRIADDVRHIKRNVDDMVVIVDFIEDRLQKKGR